MTFADCQSAIGEVQAFASYVIALLAILGVLLMRDSVRSVTEQPEDEQ